MAGTVIISLLPDDGLRHTARLAIALLTLFYWINGIFQLCNIDFPTIGSSPMLVDTSFELTQATAETIAQLQDKWVIAP